MMVRAFTILLVIISGILCSRAQQGISSTQAGQTLQIQPNVRKYNKHTATEKPCTTAGSTSGTRKDKPADSSDGQDYVPIGGPAAGYPYPYPAYPYPYPPVGPTPGNLVLVPSGSPYRPAPQYPYEPQYSIDGGQQPTPYYPPYYPAAPSPPPPPPPPPYPALSYPPPPAYPAPQSLYEQANVVEAYRSPPLSPYLQQQPAAEQSQFFRQPVTAGQYYYVPPQQSGPLPSPHFRAHAHNRPIPTAAPPAFLQQRDVSATATAAANNAEPQYEQQSGPFDGNQFHF